MRQFSRNISPPTLSTPSRIAGELVLAHVVKDLNLAPSSAVVDIGCGFGEYRFLFPDAEYFGCDLDFTAIRSLARHHSWCSIGNAEAVPIATCSCDVVFSSFAFEYFEHPSVALREIARILRVGGCCVLCLPARWISIYDLPSNLIRRLGLPIGQISAQEGVRTYTPRQLKSMVRESGLDVKAIIPTYGLTLWGFKIVTSWSRFLRHIAVRALTKAAPRLDVTVPPLYISRKVTFARDFAEWKDILDETEQTATLLQRLYVTIVRMATFIDRGLGSLPAIEYVAVLQRSRT